MLQAVASPQPGSVKVPSRPSGSVRCNGSDLSFSERDEIDGHIGHTSTALYILNVPVAIQVRLTNGVNCSTPQKLPYLNRENDGKPVDSLVFPSCSDQAGHPLVPSDAQCPRLHLSETFSILILIFHLAWQLHVLLVAFVGLLSQSKREMKIHCLDCKWLKKRIFEILHFHVVTYIYRLNIIE